MPACFRLYSAALASERLIVAPSWSAAARTPSDGCASRAASPCRALGVHQVEDGVDHLVAASPRIAAPRISLLSRPPPSS